MPIKVNLEDILVTASAAGTDYALISYGYNGAARLLALDDIPGAGGVFYADDGNPYRLTGTVVDGIVTLGCEPA